MGKCSVVSDSSGKVNDENQQQVETFRSSEDLKTFTLILCELQKQTKLLEIIVRHQELITDEEGL